MAAFIGLQQDSLEFRSNASISAYPGQKKESVWTQKASACHIIYCAWRGSEWRKLLTWATVIESTESLAGLQIHPGNTRTFKKKWRGENQS